MKIIQSKNYRYKEIIKNSQYDSGVMHLKIQNITEAVHNGQDIYEAINNEFINLQSEQIEKIKDFIFQSLGKPVETSNPDAYSTV